MAYLLTKEYLSKYPNDVEGLDYFRMLKQHFLEQRSVHSAATDPNANKVSRIQHIC